MCSEKRYAARGRKTIFPPKRTDDNSNFDMDGLVLYMLENLKTGDCIYR